MAIGRERQRTDGHMQQRQPELLLCTSTQSTVALDASLTFLELDHHTRCEAVQQDRVGDFEGLVSE